MYLTTAALAVDQPNRPTRAHLQRGVDPLRLRLLLEVERLGSITRAAEACSMSQPAASTHLRTLERLVGQRLCERAGRATRLTDAGRLFAGHAGVVLSSLEGLEEELAALSGAHTGTLTVASCEAFGIYVLPAALSEFAAARPRAEIQVRIAPSGEVVRAVANGDARIGIAGRMPRSNRVDAEPLLVDRLVWVASADADPPAVLTPPLLRELTMVVPGADSSTRAVVERSLSRLEHRPARLLEVDSVEAVKRAVACGAGIAAVSRLSVAGELAAGELCEVELAGAGRLERVLEVVRHRHREPTPLERAFHHVLRRHAHPLGGAFASRAACGIP
jgi:molybdate transport repressor ModE-like protein